MKKTMNAKKLVNLAFIISGGFLLLGGLALYGLGTHALLPAPCPKPLCWILLLLGVFLIVAGVCELFFKKTKEMEIAEKDERNVMLANEAKALAYEVMTVLFALVLTAMGLIGALTASAFFAFFAVFVIAQLTFIARLWYLQKNR